MSSVKYTMSKIEGTYKEAKISELNNLHQGTLSKFPGVMFHVKSSEDLSAVKRYYFQQLPHEHIVGFTVPFSKLSTYIPQLLDNVPHNITYMCDLETEVFWWVDMKQSVKDFFNTHLSFYNKIKEYITIIGSKQNIKERTEAHRQLWEDIINNKRVLMKLLTSYVNRQNQYQVDIISSFGPLILDGRHIDLVEECYNQTKRLYHNASNDIEQQGKLIALYSNFNTSFLSKKSNIVEFLKMLERTTPKALVFKLSTLEDIREKISYQTNYDMLIKGIGNLSQSFNMPVFYFSSHTEGYRANTHGVDVFCEPFNKKHNVEIEINGLSQNARQRLLETNPLFISGKIYDIKTGEFITRTEFQKTRVKSDGIDSPILNLSQTKADAILPMTDRSFREFAKILLMESRNYEEEQLHEGIENNDLTKIQNKLAKWDKSNILR